jgi:hypothetical protein
LRPAEVAMVLDPDTKDGGKSTVKGAAAEGGDRPEPKTIFNSLSKVLLASGFVGFLGTAITSYFQWNNAKFESAVAKINKVAAGVVDALDALNNVIDEKFLSTYEMDDAIATRAEGDKLREAINRFHSTNAKWEKLHTRLASRLEIAVDSQFERDNPNLMTLVNSLDCLTYTLKGQQPSGKDPLPVRTLLDISYRCHSLLKSKIDAQIKAWEANDSRWPDATTDPDPDKTILGHIWQVNRALQCMMVERALELRNQSPQALFAPFVASGQPETYVTTSRERNNEERCIEPYKYDKVFGENPEAKNEPAETTK